MLDLPDVHSKLQRALLYHQSGQLQHAETLYQQVLDIDPKNADALHLLGLIRHQSGQSETAIILIKRAIEISPNQTNFLRNLANILRESGQFQKSVQIFKRIIQLCPKSAEIYDDFGLTLADAGQFESAMRAYYRAIELDPNYDGAYLHLGDVLKKQDKLEEAIRAYQQATEVNPTSTEACYKLSGAQLVKLNSDSVLQVQDRLEEASRILRKVIEINPSHADAHHKLGLVLLLKGDFRRGWKEYEWRWKCDGFSSEKRDFPQPMWDGSSLSDKSIVIWFEQGVGDQIMFASLLFELQKQARRVLVEVEHRLVPILQRSFSGICFFPSQELSHPKLLDVSIDFQSPASSLPQWLLPDEESFPGRHSYLQACRYKTQELRNKYQQLADDKLLIGISWKSKNEKFGEYMSTSLAQWADLFSQKDCIFINLQYGNVKKEIDEFNNQTGISIYQDKEIDSLENLDDFAAQVAAVDLVLSVSNTTVHMAGALGKPVWTLIRYVPNYKWMIDRSDSPWYPSMILFRQKAPGDWDSVFQQIVSKLEKLVRCRKINKT